MVVDIAAPFILISGIGTRSILPMTLMIVPKIIAFRGISFLPVACNIEKTVVDSERKITPIPSIDKDLYDISIS